MFRRHLSMRLEMSNDSNEIPDYSTSCDWMCALNFKFLGAMVFSRSKIQVWVHKEFRTNSRIGT